MNASATELDQQTYLPDEDAPSIAQVYDFLAAHEDRHGERPVVPYVLSGPEPGDRVEVPQEVHRVLLHVVRALKAGKAVTIAPQTTMLTTQQAADLLNVSRPTLVKLLDEGRIPFERPSTRRQVRLADVLAYLAERREAQYAALAATAVDLDDGEDLETIRRRIKAARAAVAARERQN